MAVHIRALRDEDQDGWRALWSGYLAFYEADVPAATTDGVWARMMDAHQPLLGWAAERGGELVGFAIVVMHQGTWTLRPIAYLEDLFVAPAARGRGVGARLIETVLAEARRRGAARLYWHTAKGNVAARRLYDRFAFADDFVRYRLFLDQR